MNIGVEIKSSCVANAPESGGELPGRVSSGHHASTAENDSGISSLMQQEEVPSKLMGKEVSENLDEKKRRRKKKWKKPKDKPSRPLSAYNLFFQSERSRMLGADAPSQELENRKKKIHCKTHGKIGFAEMARAIGGKWKSLETDKKRIFEELAKKEKERYSAELGAWKDTQKKHENGLDTIAAAAMTCAPLNSDQTSTKSSESHSNVLLMAMVEKMRLQNLSIIQQRQSKLEYLRALQDHQFSFSPLNSPLMSYPCAAEGSASALLQQFQGMNQLNLTPIPSNRFARMRQFQYVSTNELDNMRFSIGK